MIKSPPNSRKFFGTEVLFRISGGVGEWLALRCLVKLSMFIVLQRRIPCSGESMRFLWSGNRW